MCCPLLGTDHFAITDSLRNNLPLPSPLRLGYVMRVTGDILSKLRTSQSKHVQPMCTPNFVLQWVRRDLLLSSGSSSASFVCAAHARARLRPCVLQAAQGWARQWWGFSLCAVQRAVGSAAVGHGSIGSTHSNNALCFVLWRIFLRPSTRSQCTGYNPLRSVAQQLQCKRFSDRSHGGETSSPSAGKLVQNHVSRSDHDPWSLTDLSLSSTKPRFANKPVCRHARAWPPRLSTRAKPGLPLFHT